jgi:hypothetical protein
VKRRICALVAVVVCSSFAILRNSLVAAQAGTAAGGFTIEQVLDYPFPGESGRGTEWIGNRVDVC